MKCAAYSGRDKIRDMYDVCFITNTYFSQLSPDTQDQLRISFEAKGIEQFDYIINTQQDDLIDANKLADDMLTAFDKLGLLASDDNSEVNKTDTEILIEKETERIANEILREKETERIANETLIEQEKERIANEMINNKDTSKDDAL